VILSAGTIFETFLKEVELACKAGASGFLAGRAVWQEAIDMTDAQERRRFIETVAADRLKKLTETAQKYAVPWYKKLGMEHDRMAEIIPGWHAEYKGNI
jgi:tagatose 1,6-diphosphate aldolase